MAGKGRTSKFRAPSLPEGGLPEGEWITFRPRVGPASSGIMSPEWIIFTAFSDKVPLARYKGALNQIHNWRKYNNLPPLAGKRLKDCIRKVDIAIRSVEYLKEVALFVTTPKKCKKTFEVEARKRRKAAELLSGEARRMLEEEAAVWDRRAAVKQPRFGTKARDQAVDWADQLFEQFGDKAPGRSKDGPWVRLSGILFDETGANMFAAVRRFRRPPRP